MGTYKSRIKSTVVGALATISVLCSVHLASADSMDDIVAAAKKEGALVVYHNQRAQGIEPLLQKFREAYPGIETQAVRVTSNAMMERFLTEYNAGRHIADIVITFSDERVVGGLKENWMTEWVPPEISNFAPEYNQENKLYTLSHAREALIWNKNLVSDADAPKEWSDLFDPKWKGKVGINPPWRAVPILQLVAYWEDRLKLGDTAQKLKDNDVFFFEGSGGISQAVIRGDVQVAEITDSTLNPLLDDGAPLGVRYPDSGTTTSATVAFLPKDAPHPNAAKVMLNWLMTEKGQQDLQDDLALPVTRKGMPALSNLPATGDLKNVVAGPAVLSPERRDQIVSHWQQVFGVK